VFTKVATVTASDRTQLTVWTAVVATGGTRPVITAKASGTADLGVAALEYSGLSTAAGAAAVEQQATGTATTAGAGVVRPASTTPLSADGELVVGFYVDSGFNTALSGDAGFTGRVNLSPNRNMDLLVQDAVLNTGATPAAGVTTGASTVWLAATVVFRHG